VPDWHVKSQVIAIKTPLASRPPAVPTTPTSIVHAIAGVLLKAFREMSLSVQLADLSSVPAYLFADWPNLAVSTFGAGV
jgi:hypothetical protein